MDKQIGLIIPYFGRLPSYFPYFVESVSHSPIIDVLLFTDARIEIALPSNIKVFPLTLPGFNRLASRALSMPVSVSSPYKLCDFKPMYGIIFHEHIRDYEFWAFGDIDVVYGDLEHFLAPLMPGNDIVSCRKHWVSGSLCVLRNCVEVNTAYTCSSTWQNVVMSPDCQQFDEMGGQFFKKALNGADLRQMNSKVDSFTHVITRLSEGESLRCAFKDLACEGLNWDETLVYDNGKLTRTKTGSEVMYVHYVCMKRRFFEVPHTAMAPRHFYIRKTGIYTKRPSLRVICLQEGPRVIRRGLNVFGRLLGRCFKGVSFERDLSGGQQ